MVADIIDAVIAEMTPHISPFTGVQVGSMPLDNSLAVYPAPSDWSGFTLNHGGKVHLRLILNGKHTNQRTLIQTLANVQIGLMNATEHASGATWKIIVITPVMAPNLVGEESGQYIYTSSVDVFVEKKGV